MATVRTGSKGVLIVVDMQVGVLRAAWEAERVVLKLARAVERARAQQIPVIWVQHADAQLQPETPDWAWVPALQPAANEALLAKRYNSAFEQTGLETLLAGLGASHITLAGAATNWCIRATAYAALERGYDLTLLSDAHTTETLVLDDGSRIEAATVVAELNTVMAWLAYPGRHCGTALAESARFSV